MSDTDFWRILDQASAAPGGYPEAQLNRLHNLLLTLPPDQIAAFERGMSAQLDRSYRWDLLGAASVVHGGASDDGFEYFRLWLISKGRAVFEAVLEDPDRLADLDLAPGPDGVYELEALAYVPEEAWAKKTGRPAEEMGRVWTGIHFDELAGEEFDDSPEGLATRYPKLWKKYGRHPLG